MKLKPTERGFMKVDFIDAYKAKCSIQKSSAAMYDAIWLGLDNADPKIMVSDAIRMGIYGAADRTGEERNGWMTYVIPDEVSLNTRMHLTQGMVQAILPTLQAFAETGELLATDEYSTWKIRHPDVKIERNMLQVMDMGKSPELYFTAKFLELAKENPYAYRIIHMFRAGATPQEIIEVLCDSMTDMINKVKELSAFQSPPPMVINMDWSTAPDWIKEKYTKGQP